LNVERSGAAGRAVFLSYASQDAEAALRIAEALRAAGVEVWFDQSELVGGDAWDQQIRRQIKECTLFIPVISENTQARREGYFRIEWRLAAQRTHALADGTPFLLPVVIDTTRDADALVPEEFRAVQWTRIGSADSLVAFCACVKNLLGGEAVARAFPVRRAHGPELVEGQRVSTDPGTESTRSKTRVTASLASRGIRVRWIAPSVLAILILGGGIGWFALQPKLESIAPAGSASPPRDSSPVPSAAGLAKVEGLAKGDKSIAVLPFENRSEDKDANAFFADGMHDELLSALAKIGALKVISRTSVLEYRDPAKPRNLKQIGTEFGVAHILEGSVSRAGKSVRIIVQLIDAATGVQRWAETYPLKEVTDVFQVQADIAAKIAASLAATISPGEKRALAQKLTSNPAAYENYLHGRRWRELGRRELSSTAIWEERIVRPLEKAVELDPKFAAAYAELGQVHGELYWWHFLDPSPGRLAKARAAIDTALRLEPALPMAHLALGTYYYRLLDYSRATEEYAVALAAMPGDTEVLFYLSSTQRRQGRWVEAAANQERAFGIDPLHPTYGPAWISSLLILRLYRQAEKAADRVLEMNPAMRELVLRLKAEARFARDGDAARYRTVLAETREADASPQLVEFRQAFYDGRYADAVRIFDEAPGEMDNRDRRSANSRSLNEYFYAANAAGHREKARARASAGIAATSRAAKERRDEWRRVARLAMLYAYAGQPVEARQFVGLTLELMPLKRDALDGARALNELTQVYLALGDHDRALALLDQAMSVPNEVSANEILHFEPWWKPLHHDPRFKAALAKAAPRD
jgi:TolB-like protein